MSSSSNLLVSGGVDTNLISYTTDKFPKIARETNSYPQKPLITLSKESKLLCCQFPQKIEIWGLGTSSFPTPFFPLSLSHSNPAALAPTFSGFSHTGVEDMLNGTVLSLSKKEEKLLELTSKVLSEIHLKLALTCSHHPRLFLPFFPPFSQSGGNIVCSSISNDGNWLAFSNAREFKLFRLKLEVCSARLSSEEMTLNQLFAGRKARGCQGITSFQASESCARDFFYS